MTYVIVFSFALMLFVSITQGVVFDWGKKVHAEALENSSIQPEENFSNENLINNSAIEFLVEEKIRQLASKVTHGLYEQRQKNRHQDRQLRTLSSQLSAVKEDLKNEKLVSRKRQGLIRNLQIQLENQNLQLGRAKNDILELRVLLQELGGGKSWPTREPILTEPTVPVPSKGGYPRDCNDVLEDGDIHLQGSYYVVIQPGSEDKPFKVACQIENDSGWTVIQRREDGSVDFYKTWADYKRGFGDIEGEFWLGNDHMHQITNQGRNYKLRIEMEDFDGKKYYAEYNSFRVDNEKKKYTLHISGYHGNSGDSLTSRWSNHDGLPFSTYDNDNDRRFFDNCAKHYNGAWWFRDCFQSHLNGVYYKKGLHNNYFQRNGIQWNTIHLHSSLRSVSMMIKPYDLVTPNLV